MKIAYVKPRRYRPRSSNRSQSVNVPRKICYGCFRPVVYCFCDLIPRVENKTDILILQHRREREHPFNTARMVNRALSRSKLIFGRSSELGEQELPLKPDAGLLYPSPFANLLPSTRSDRPSQLVILDGTWHHAKALLRDIPAIQDLPRYQLTPQTPGQYRIRLEPTDTSLSTVEATVAALKMLEPDLRGLDQLLDVFNTMVDRQLAHPDAKYDGLTLAQKQQLKPNIPYALIHDLENIVVAYGESAGGERERAGEAGKKIERRPVYWVAKRLGTNELFAAAIDPGPDSLSAKQLRHLDLDSSFFEQAMCIEEFAKSWREFSRPTDTLGVFKHGSLNLLKSAGLATDPSFVLKCVKTQPGQKLHSLHHVIEAHRLQPEPVDFPGRAGRRLAGVIAYAKYLNKRAAELL